MRALVLLAPLVGACTFLVGEAHPDDASIEFPDFATPCDPSLLTSDVRNCGACGHDCTRLPGVDASHVRCVIGACDLTNACQVARADCTGADGCETDLSTVANCGACGNACPAAAPRCIGISPGAFTCSASCGGTTPTQCGADCVDTETDPLHCSDCSTVCPVPQNGFALCDFFGCSFDCDPGFLPSGNSCVPDVVLDMSVPLDFSMRDMRMVDLRMVDFSMPDLRMVDLRSVDMANVDAGDAGTVCLLTPCTMPADCIAIGCTTCAEILPGFSFCQ